MSMTYVSGSPNRGLVSRGPTSRIAEARPRIVTTYAPGWSNRGIGCREPMSRTAVATHRAPGKGRWIPWIEHSGHRRARFGASDRRVQGCGPTPRESPPCPTYFSPETLAATALRDETTVRGMVLRGVVSSTSHEERKNTEVVIMGSNTPNNKLEETTADQSLIDGLNNIASTIPSFVIGGATVPTKDIVTTLQARLATAKAAESARATWRTSVQADRDERAKTKTLVSVIKQNVAPVLRRSNRHARNLRTHAAQAARRETRETGRRGRQGQSDPRSASHHGQEAEGRDHGRVGFQRGHHPGPWSEAHSRIAGSGCTDAPSGADAVRTDDVTRSTGDADGADARVVVHETVETQ